MTDSLAIAATEVSPMQVLQQAVAAGANVEQLTQLLALQERYEANQAKKAFNVAFSAFKAEAIKIVRNITIQDGPLKGKKHADLYGVVSEVTPALSRHGLSHSWKLTKDDPSWMEVTCTIRHELGYSEPTSMGAAPDSGPGRNAIQARGSAKTYLERYTLLAAIGMAAAGQDDDGKGSGGFAERMDEDDIVNWIDLIAQSKDKIKMAEMYKSAYDEAKLVKDNDARARFIEARDKRRQELS